MPPPPLPQQNGKAGPPPLPTSAPQFKNKSGPPPLPTSVGTPPLPATSATQKLAEGELFLGMAKSAFDEQRFDETEVNLAMDAFIEVLRLEPGNERAQEGLGTANCLLASITDAKREQEREREVENRKLQVEQAQRAEEQKARRQTAQGAGQSFNVRSGEKGVTKARRFLCPHCCTIYNGIAALGDTTRCDKCFEDFVVRPFYGDQDSLLPNPVEGIFALFAGHKCPGCSSRKSKLLDVRSTGQRVMSGRWHNFSRSFYMCKDCGSTWYYCGAVQA